MKKLISILVIALLIVGCAPKSAESEVLTYAANGDMAISEEEIEVIQTAQEAPPPPPLSSSQTVLQQKQIIKKKIIKDGRMGIQVKDLVQTKALVDAQLKSAGGYYDNENLSNSSGGSTYFLKIRIPAAQFDQFLNQIEKGGNKILYKEITAQDVTEEFVDLETRLANKRSYVSQYQNLLSRANKIEDILQIQEKIRALEEEIESTVGRLRYISDQVDYSTLELNLETERVFKFVPQNRENFSERLKQSLSGGWYNLVDFLLALLSNWALLILFGVIGYFVVKLWRKRKAGKAEKKKLNS